MLIQNLIITLASLAFSTAAQARNLPVPHGPDIDGRAAACSLGNGENGLGQTSKAGPYNRYCDSLTEAEICLATIKDSINFEGTLRLTSLTNTIKAEYCLNTFRDELIGAQ